MISVISTCSNDASDSRRRDFANRTDVRDSSPTTLSDQAVWECPVTDFIEDVYGFKAENLRSPTKGYSLSWVDAVDYGNGQRSKSGERSADKPLERLLSDLMKQIRGAMTENTSAIDTDLQLVNVIDECLAGRFDESKPDFIWGWTLGNLTERCVVAAVVGVLEKTCIKKKITKKKIDLDKIAQVRSDPLRVFSSSILTQAGIVFSEGARQQVRVLMSYPSYCPLIFRGCRC